MLDDKILSDLVACASAKPVPFVDLESSLVYYAVSYAFSDFEVGDRPATHILFSPNGFRLLHLDPQLRDSFRPSKVYFESKKGFAGELWRAKVAVLSEVPHSSFLLVHHDTVVKKVFEFKFITHDLPR